MSPTTIKTIIYGLCLPLFLSCIKQDECNMAAHSSDYTVSITFSAQEATELSTRTLTASEEAMVTDVNLYAVQPATGIMRHWYIAGKMNEKIILSGGVWELYARANQGYDLGELDDEALAAMQFEAPVEGSIETGVRLPMSARQTVTVNGNTSLTLRLVRLAARLQVNVGVTPGMNGRITLTGIQLLNVPTAGFCFKEGRCGELTDYQPHTVSDNLFPYACYIPENLAGTITGISESVQRTAANAPKEATYIRLSGTCDGKKVYYHIYPGENQTSDFNIRRNHAYTMNITIFGANPSDYRVSVHELTLSPPAGKFTVGQRAEATLVFTAENNTDNVFDISFIPTTGNPWVTINGSSFSPCIFAEGLSGTTIRRSFTVGISSPSVGYSAAQFIVTDSRGAVIAQDFGIDFIRAAEPEITLTTTVYWGSERIDYGSQYALIGFVDIELTASSPVPEAVSCEYGVYYEQLNKATGYMDNRDENRTITIEKGMSAGYRRIMEIPESNAPVYSTATDYRIKEGLELVGTSVRIFSTSKPPEGVTYQTSPPVYVQPYLIRK